MNISNGWMNAAAVNGEQIRVKVIPFMREQNNILGKTWVEVSKQIEFESGETFSLNLDGKSFYAGLNKLYKLIF